MTTMLINGEQATAKELDRRLYNFYHSYEKKHIIKIPIYQTKQQQKIHIACEDDVEDKEKTSLPSGLI